MKDMYKYDIVIIGAGLGGLLCGIILAKHGYSVCILEQHSQIGGNIQTFTRKGCTFTTGMHYIGSLDKGQILYKLFKYLGILDKIIVKRLDNCFEKILIEDDEYCYEMGNENFKNRLISYFPNEKTAIEKYVNEIDSIWNKVKIINLREVSDTEVFKGGFEQIGAYSFIDSLTDNYKLKGLLAATNGLYAGVKDKTPLYTHAIINKFFINSAWKLDERNINFASALQNIFESLGGEILTGTKVEKIICRDKQAVAALTSQGNKITAKSFISNIHPTLTNSLIEPGILRKAYINRINAIENSISPFSIYIVLKKKSFKHINSNVYYSKTYDDVWGIDNYNTDRWPQGFIFYTTPCKQHPGYAESATIITFMKFEEVKKWDNTRIGKRGDDYLDFKAKKAEKLLHILNEKIPGIKQSIDSFYTSTPLTFKDYTGSPGGSMYGLIKDYKDPLSTFVSHNTRVPNLFLTGQNVNLHGMLGVSISSLITCSGFVDINKLINEIKDE